MNELKRHLNTILEAIVALCPSRNYTSQFISFLPDEYAAIYDMFPEFLSDRAFREKLARLLGLSLGPRIELIPGSFAAKLRPIIDMVHQLLNDDGFRQEWDALLKENRAEAVPNPLHEWVVIKAQVARNDPVIGPAASKILTVFKNPNEGNTSICGESGTLPAPRMAATADELSNQLQVPLSDIQDALDFLCSKVYLIEKVTEGTDASSSRHRYRLASEVRPEWMSEP